MNELNYLMMFLTFVLWCVNAYLILKIRKIKKTIKEQKSSQDLNDFIHDITNKKQALVKITYVDSDNIFLRRR